MGYNTLVIRFEEDFCDQELTSLHLSFIVKILNFKKKKKKREFFLAHFSHFIGFMDKGEKQTLLKVAFDVICITIIFIITINMGFFLFCVVIDFVN